MMHKSLMIKGVARSYKKGSHLYFSGDQIEKIIYLTHGYAHILATRPNGYRQIIERYTAEDFIAPHSLFGEYYFFSAEAASDIETVEYSTSSFRKAIKSEAGRIFWSELLQAHLFRTLKRVEMLTYPTVNEKLDAWIKMNGVPPAKGEYTNIANELGVSREAFYRELGRRRGG